MAPTAGIVPIIDFAPFLSGSAQDKKRCAETIVSAARDVGFMMLTGFEASVSTATVEEAFKQTRAFFDLPLEVKEKLAWQTPESNRGYVRQGRERVTQATKAEDIAALRAAAPDVKETMEIGEDDNIVSPWKNMWPDDRDLASFKPFMKGFFEDCHQLHVQVMRALALGLGLDQQFFDKMVDQRAHNLRLLNYPSVESSKLAQGASNRAGEHTDYGSITLLFQDDVGGLQVQAKDGSFVPADPVPNTVVVNIGDLLMRWSNDVLKSTIHRVLMPSNADATGMTPRRNSIAFFSNPNLHQMIECIPGTGTPKYEPVECEQYLVKRLAETYA